MISVFNANSQSTDFQAANENIQQDVGILVMFRYGITGQFAFGAALDNAEIRELNAEARRQIRHSDIDDGNYGSHLNHLNWKAYCQLNEARLALMKVLAGNDNGDRKACLERKLDQLVVNLLRLNRHKLTPRERAIYQVSFDIRTAETINVRIEKLERN